jgi:hypothetical protein
MRIRLSLAIIFLIIFLPDVVYPQRAVASGEDIEEKNFYLMAGYLSSLHSAEFFEIYDNYLDGLANRFKPSINLGAGTKFEIADRLKLALAGNYFFATLKDSYDQIVEFPEPGTRSIAQEIKVESIPLILSLEYIPYDAQFRTYFGGGGGICFGNIMWNEVVASDIRRDPRTGGEHFAENNVFPAMRFLAGVELGFDKYNRQTLLGSLIIELRYNHIFREVDFFRKIKRQFESPPEAFDRPVGLITGFLELNAAVSLNFNTKLARSSKQ